MEVDKFYKEKINVNADKKISLALMGSFVILTLQYAILVYFDLLEGNAVASLVQLISKGFVGLLYLYALPSVLKRNNKSFLMIYFIFLFVFFVQFALFSDNRLFLLGIAFQIFFMDVPTFIYALSIKNLGTLKKIMWKVSHVVFILGSLIGILVLIGRVDVGGYSISLSYYMLLPAIMFFDQLLESFSIKYLIFLSLTLSVILALGSRGAIMCILVFILLRFFKIQNKKSSKKLIWRFTVIGLAIVSILFLEKILIGLYNFLLQFGIDSRSLQLFSSGEISLSGRDSLYKTVFQQILENPILGIGIEGDTRILGDSYVHNFFIELIGNFGVIIGSILAIFLLFLIIYNLVFNNNDKYNMAIIWLSLGFIHLMVSSSYLIDIKFWIFLGILINQLLRNNKQVEYTQQKNSNIYRKRGSRVYG